jgi:hypothetical protein
MNIRARMTTIAFLSSRLFGVPFWVMLSALALILYKEFHVSPFVLTLFVALKPASALLATYWSSFFHADKKNLVWRLCITNILRFLPFLVIGAIPHPTYFVFAFAWYMMLSRGCVPAWMELFKKNLPSENRTRILSVGNTVEYIGVTLLPLAVGMILDQGAQSWKMLFPLTALIGMASTLFLIKVPTPECSVISHQKIHLAQPWIQTLKLLKSDRAFLRYQVGFMLAGAGLMLIQPALPPFFVDRLSLSYTQMMLAMAVCKGLGYTLVSPLWSRLFDKTCLFKFSSFVCLAAIAFPPCLFFSQWGLTWLYLSYLVYGMMQAGSEISWHLSPLSFSKDSESSPYSETNILAVGLRGCLIPWVGGLLSVSCSFGVIFMLSGLCCLSGLLILNGPKQSVVFSRAFAWLRKA